MERRLGVIALGAFALALSMSTYAQQTNPKDQLGEADAQERQPSIHERDAGDPAAPLEAVEEKQAEGKQVDGPSATAAATGQTSDVRETTRLPALRQLALQHADLTAFVQALEATGLAAIIAKGEYTAFAPTNEAFESAGIDLDALDQAAKRDRLMALLRNHLVAESVAAAQVKELDHTITVGGETLALSAANGELKVNDARVMATDIRAGSLIVHTIDRVLEPAAESATSTAQSPAAEGSQIAIPSATRDANGMQQASGSAPQVTRDDERR